MSAYLEYSRDYSSELKRFQFRISNWSSWPHLEREWHMPPERERRPIGNLIVQGRPWAYLTGVAPFTDPSESRNALCELEKGCTVPAWWTRVHRIWHFVAGWGAFEINGVTQLYNAPCTIVVEAQDVFSLVAARKTYGLLVTQPGSVELGLRPSEEEVKEAAKVFPLVAKAIAV